MKIKGHTVGTPPPLNQKADYDAVFGYNLFNGGATRTENGITITATSLSASGTWDNLATTTTLAQFCPRAVVGRKYVITYGTLTDIMGDKMPIGVMEGGVIKWLPSGTEFVFTEEVAGSGLYLFTGDTGGGFGEFYASYIMVSEEEREYEPSVTLGQSIAVGKLDKVNGGYRLYATDGSGKQVSYGFSTSLLKSSFPMRKSKGEIETGTATAPNDAVPLSQMNEALAEKDVEIGILKKRVVNLEQGITPDPYLTDDSTAYVKTVPADALPYARLEAVGGMTHKIITELPIDPAYLGDLWAQDTDPSRTVGLIVDMFPGAEVGKTYTLAYDVTPSDLPFVGYLEPSGKFTLTANTELVTNCSGTYDEAAYTTFSNVRLVEPAVLRETKVTAIESVGKNLFDESAVTEIVNYSGVTSGTDIKIDDYLSVRVGTDNNSALFSPFVFCLEGGQQARISADFYVESGSPSLQVYVMLHSPAKSSATGTSSTSGVYTSVSSYDTWERKSVTLTAKERRWFLLGTQPKGSKGKLRIKNITVTTDTTATEYIPYRKHTFDIPAEVKDLPGYGWGIPEGAHNGIEFDDEGKAVYVKRVERKVYNGTEDWRGGSSGDDFYVTCFESTGGKYGAKGLSNKWAWRTPRPCVYTSNQDHRYMSVRPEQYATTDAEWKALLAKWQAEGNPLTAYYELAEPIVTDISHLVTRDNFIEVEGGGIIIAQNENADAAPTAIKYQLKEG